MTSITDPNNHTATLSYDSSGNLTQFSGPAGISISAGYDSLGLLNVLTDGNGNVWPFQNNSSGDMISAADPLGRTLVYAYDQRHRVKSISLMTDGGQSNLPRAQAAQTAAPPSVQ